AGRARPPGDDAGSGPRPDDDQIMCGHAEHSPYHGPPGRSARRGASLRQVATGTPTMPTGFVRRHPQGGIIWLHAAPTATAATRVRDVRWGDFLNIEAQRDDGWMQIRWGTERYFIRGEDVVATRPLEIVFVDVGQGDGCFVVPPEAGPRERVLVIDAGERRNMLGMLRWRFGKLMREFRFHAA